MFGQSQVDLGAFLTRLQFFVDSSPSRRKISRLSSSPVTHPECLIQPAVKTTAGEEKVAANVNTDETAVLGDSLRGASLSRQFKTKVSDVYMYTTKLKEG